jgi:chitinase
MRSTHSVCGLLLLAVSALSQPAHPAAKPTGTFAAYFESWLSHANDRFDADLVSVPKPVTIVLLAFIRPDAQYSGNLLLAGTGLEFNYSGATLRNSLAELRRRNPGIKIFVSVGGVTYTKWDRLNAQGLARFVDDFGLDGIDVDFEPEDPGCVQSDNSISCKTDALLQRSVAELRSALPHAAELSLTCTATSAFGEGAWKNAGPKGGTDYGTLVQFLHSPAAHKVDFLNVMAYDAGEDYDPLQGLAAFRHYYRGPILLGFSPPPEDWGGHSYTNKEINDVLQTAMANGAAGAMLFSLRKGTGPGAFTPYLGVIADVMKRSHN